jgi:hypothetical protein
MNMRGHVHFDDNVNYNQGFKRNMKGKAYSNKNVKHSQGFEMNMKGQAHFDGNVSHNQSHTRFERKVNHNQSSHRNIKDRCISKRTFIIAKEMMKTIWARCILKRMFTKAIIPILGIMILFMEAHKCVLIVM